MLCGILGNAVLNSFEMSTNLRCLQDVIVQTKENIDITVADYTVCNLTEDVPTFQKQVPDKGLIVKIPLVLPLVAG